MSLPFTVEHIRGYGDERITFICINHLNSPLLIEGPEPFSIKVIDPCFPKSSTLSLEWNPRLKDFFDLLSIRSPLLGAIQGVLINPYLQE